jgi:NAD(P)-dependent dehydrogenase (short-subunit alcohol dehydrogenase family)
MNSKKYNKTALVTGAAKRVGKAIAIALAADGWNVALHHNSTDIFETARECEKLGAKVCFIKADLNSFADLQRIMPEANAALGEISLLINNASIFEKCSFAETTEDIFDRHMNINFKAPFFLSQQFAQQTQNGQIINICDTNIARNNTTYFAYLLSKKSLSSLTKMSAVEIAPQIRINEICIGITELSDTHDEDFLTKRIAGLPLQRKTSLQEITETILHLSKADYLTGQSIFLDSGEQLL